MAGYRLTPYNQIDDYGQEKMWKMSKQAPRKRKSQIAFVVEVCQLPDILWISFPCQYSLFSNFFPSGNV